MTHPRLYLIVATLTITLIWILGLPESHAHHANKKMWENNPRGPWIYELVGKKSSSHRFRKNGRIIVKGGHVPTLTEKGKQVFLYYQWFSKEVENRNWFDHIGVSITTDYGDSWSMPTGINFSGVPHTVFGSRTRPMDPCAVTLANGQIRIYFTLEPFGPHHKVLGDAQIHSAISNDGINFTYEPGIRLAISDVDLRDPAAVYFKGKWHLYIPNQRNEGTGYYASSSDGLNFVRQRNVKISNKGNWLGNATVAEGNINFFGTVWRATSKNGVDWKTSRSTLGPDPAIVHLKNGSWLGVTFRKNRDH